MSGSPGSGRRRRCCRRMSTSWAAPSRRPPHEPGVPRRRRCNHAVPRHHAGHAAAQRFSAIRQHAQTPPEADTAAHPADGDRDHRAAVFPHAVSADPRHGEARRPRGARRAHHRARARAGRGRAAGVGHDAGNLAGQRRRPLQPRARPARRAARPAFQGRRAACSPTRRAGTSSPRSSRARIPGATTTTPGDRTISTSRCSGRASPRGWSRRCIFPATRCWNSTRSSTACRTRTRASG